MGSDVKRVLLQILQKSKKKTRSDKKKHGNMTNSRSNMNLGIIMLRGYSS